MTPAVSTSTLPSAGPPAAGPPAAGPAVAEPDRDSGSTYRAWLFRRVCLVGALVGALTLSLLVAFGSTPAEAVSTKTIKRQGVIKLTNAIRKANGCRPLKNNKKLRKAAQRHANDMARKRYFSHTSANGTIWWKRIERAGFKRPGGENIARGYSSPSSVVNAWMNSPGHRRNILDCSFRRIGIGYNPNGSYYVQDFGY